MTDTRPVELAPPGWYADPNGSGRRRWWNGLAWTPHLEGDRVYPGTVPGAVMQPLLPTSLNVNPWPVWVIALLPIVSATAVLFLDLNAYFRAVLIASQRGTLAISPSVLTQFAVLQLVSWLSMAGTVVLAFFDWRALKRRGVVQPFHWAWSFLLPPLVYLIGRSVVLRRRAGRGSAPLWTWLLVSVVASVWLSVVLIGAVNDVVLEYLNSYGTTASI